MRKPAGPVEDGLAEAAAPNLNEGHRERVRERFDLVGGESFTDAELKAIVPPPSFAALSRPTSNYLSTTTNPSSCMTPSAAFGKPS